MLGLNTITVDISKFKYPVYFEHRNTCIHCGAEGNLVFVDRFDNEYTRELGIFEYIKCKRCGRIYSIKWDRDREGRLKPSATDFSITAQFNNFLGRKEIAGSDRILQ